MLNKISNLSSLKKKGLKICLQKYYLLFVIHSIESNYQLI